MNIRQTIGRIIAGNNINKPEGVVQRSASSVSYDAIPTPPTSDIFDAIIGHKRGKDLASMVLAAPEPSHLLFSGPPGTGKSEFLSQIEQHYKKKALFINGAYASNAGMYQYMHTNRNSLKYLLIDELEKLKKEDQQGLLTLMQSGRLVKTIKTETYDIRLKAYVFATCNSTQKILEPLLDRFVLRYEVKEYTREEIIQITTGRLTRKPWKFSEELSEYIAVQVLDTLGSSQIRTCLAVATLVKNYRNKPAVDHVINTMQGDNAKEPGIEDYGS